MSKTCCKRCGANEDRINGFCSVECEEYYRLEEEINALDNVILERGIEMGKSYRRITELEAEVTKCHELQDSYCDRIAELESVINQLIEAGNTIVLETFEGYKKHGLFDFAPVNTWQVLVKDWLVKERER